MKRYFGVWQNYVKFSGRAPRSEYWTFVLVNCLIVFLLGAISNLLSGGFGNADAEPTYGPMFYLYIAFVLAAFLPGLGVAVRRLHDSGRSGFWFLVALVPILGQVVFIVFMLLGSQAGSNRYGPGKAV